MTKQTFTVTIPPYTFTYSHSCQGRSVDVYRADSTITWSILSNEPSSLHGYKTTGMFTYTQKPQN